MAKYLFPELTETLAAVVSTHGYFEIQQRDTYNSYASPMSDNVVRRNSDGTIERCPVPVVLFQGSVDELGLRYNPEYDDLEEEDDDLERIREGLLAYLEMHWNE